MKYLMLFFLFLLTLNLFAQEDSVKTKSPDCWDPNAEYVHAKFPSDSLGIDFDEWFIDQAEKTGADVICKGHRNIIVTLHADNKGRIKLMKYSQGSLIECREKITDILNNLPRYQPASMRGCKIASVFNIKLVF